MPINQAFTWDIEIGYIQLHHGKELIYKIHNPKAMFILSHSKITPCVQGDQEASK